MYVHAPPCVQPFIDLSANLSLSLSLSLKLLPLSSHTFASFYSCHILSPPMPSMCCFILTLHPQIQRVSHTVIRHLYPPLMITSVWLLINQSSAMDQSTEKLSSYGCHPCTCQSQPSHHLLPLLSSLLLPLVADTKIRESFSNTCSNKYKYSNLIAMIDTRIK